MTQCVVKGAPVDVRVPSEVKRALALAAFAGVFLAASGAFDTEAAAPLPRLAYWVLMSFLTTAALEGGHRLLRWWAPQADALHLRYWGLATLALPLTLLALLICKLVFGGYAKFEDFLALLPGMVGILVALQMVLAYSSSGTEAEPAPPRQDALTSSLPLRLRNARIYALRAEDHYVRVYTSAGEALVRMRLRDAVEALEGLPGLRPHRSWWVSEQSITALRRTRGRAILTIVGGEQVPVSRGACRNLGPDFDAPQVPPEFRAKPTS